MSLNHEQQLLIKEKIEKLINKGFSKEANEILMKYEKLFQDEKWLLTTKSVIHLLNGEIDKAEKLLKNGLLKYPYNADILFNLAYLNEQKRDFQSAYDYYLDAKFVLNLSDKEIAIKAINHLRSISSNLIEKKKIAIFVKPGLDSFIDDIINGLSDEYRIRKILVESYEQIDQGMEWADICWFEWCDELLIYGSSKTKDTNKIIICRLHRFEVFTDAPLKVNWRNVDKLFIVTSHLQNLLKEKIPNIKNIVSISVLQNGVDLNRFKLKERNPGYNIAYIGYIHLRKNPVLILQLMSELVSIDKNYKLYIAGEFQDPLVKMYWDYQIDAMGLENNIVFEGWQEEIDKWLEDKNYLLSTSIHESFGYGIAEAMARGVKPLVHNFPYSNEIWDSKYLFNTIKEAIHQVTKESYSSKEYRNYIEENYSISKQIKRLKMFLLEIEQSSQMNVLKKIKKNLTEEVVLDSIDQLTLFIPTYNRAQLVISDIKNGYKMGNQKKIIIDDCSNTENQKLLKNGLNNFNNIDIVIQPENKGVATTYKTALEKINTKLTQILGDDDLIFCYEQEDFKNSINKIGDEYSIVVPRYIVNLDSTGAINISYDRLKFEGLSSVDIIKYFFKTGEMLAMIGGAIVSTEIMKKSLPNSIFRVSEDYVALSRYFSKMPSKKIKVLDTYVYVRRVSEDTLSKTITNEKIALHLLSLIVSGYYCIVHDNMTKQDLLHTISERGKLINSLYPTNSGLLEHIMDFLNNDIELKQFIEIVQENYIPNLQYQNLPVEIKEIKNLISNEEKSVFRNES
ncbi:glycosyltransferase [Psychrobacillus lasiicapitis]|uniref:Glycosyltransferase n=1 Tax=Psychrobacillus lasiicapitis TaxID=1636719 RepID=A0A544TE27_9BACI|nr:glycosyltransferase [Psychrobacillus lasiicapitis]TQR15723.1 glycosyltransferase [Psychrobacillus lasiicapitis]GGA18544.1 glycosyl transferase [Psychrobacillus lasiicapitis]